MRSFVLVIALALAGMTATSFADPDDTEEAAPQGRSSFWGSNQPARNGAYRYRLLGIGVGLAAVTGFVMWRLVKRAAAQRAAANR